MSKKMLTVISTAAALVLTACGGSDTAPPAVAASTLSGTAAVGAPIVGGTVNVTCAAGSALNASTNSSGGWQVSVSGQTLPCAIQVTNGTVNGVAQSSPYHSIAVTLGVVNITPLTDLVIANLSAQTPSTWFGGLNGATLQAINQTAVNTAVNNINNALGLSAALAGSNPLTTAFNPVNGNLLDDILEALANAGTAHTNLLTLAQAPTFSAPNGFNFQTAYAAVQAAGGGTTGGGATTTCTGTETALTFGSSASGSPYTNGQTVCFTASSTSLAFSGKTLSNPTQNTAVSLPFSAYKFADGSSVYEVIFNASALHEINLSVSGTFKGQFAPSTGTGTGTGSGTAGNASLTLQVTAAGTTTTIPVGDVPKPSSEADFCEAVQNDGNLTRIATSGGGSLTINSCSFSGNVGNIGATVSLTSPIVISTPWTVVYTYN